MVSCALEKKVDWDAILSALAKSDYTGNLSFETCNAIAYVPAEVKTITLKNIFEIGNYFRIKLNEDKKGLFK